MTMVERVARALAGVDGVIKWMYYVPEARAAIEAMREPSEAMEVKGSDTLAHWLSRNHSNRIVGRKTFHAMIDVALSEQSA